MSFFIRKKRKESVGSEPKSTFSSSYRKSNKNTGGSHSSGPKKPKFFANEEEEIPSDTDSEQEERLDSEKTGAYSSSEEEETAQDKRLRLTKQYLADLEAQETLVAQEEDDTSAAVADRLKQDILEQAGKLHKRVAGNYLAPDQDEIKVCRGHQLAVTCVVVDPSDRFVFSGSKDCSIIKWCLETGKKVKVVPGGRKGTEEKHQGHTATVYCLAITTDNKFLASGDKNKLILLWNPESCELLHKFTGHRDTVSGLAFRRGTHQLFSASHDRTVKIWNVDELAYVETLFGHHDVITGIDSLTRERAVTAGGRDGSVRVWKVIEESQLLFHGHNGSIDAVSLIDEEHFVTGADDNSLALWSVLKKKPVATVPGAHSNDPGSAAGSGENNWISSVTSLCHTDLVASGSKDGFIRLWKCGDNFRKLENVLNIPVLGFINSIKFSSNGKFLVAGVGQEHRLGRWWRLKEAKNSVCIVPLEQKAAEPGTKGVEFVKMHETKKTYRKYGKRGRRR